MDDSALSSHGKNGTCQQLLGGHAAAACCGHWCHHDTMFSRSPGEQLLDLQPRCGSRDADKGSIRRRAAAQRSLRGQGMCRAWLQASPAGFNVTLRKATRSRGRPNAAASTVPWWCSPRTRWQAAGASGRWFAGVASAEVRSTRLHGCGRRSRQFLAQI